MANDIKTQFSGAVSTRVSGGAGSITGEQLSGIEQGASISDVGGSPIAQFDSTAPRPKAEVLPKSFGDGRFGPKRGV